MIKDSISFDNQLFSQLYIEKIKSLETPKEFHIKVINNAYANNFVLNHHYLKRKIYLAKNISYGLFIDSYLVGVIMYGYPVWTTYPGLVPPHLNAECPELIRLCTLDNLPKNSESYFVSKSLKLFKLDWFNLTGETPKMITSLCDHEMGFNGSIYKATNFIFYCKTKNTRSANPGQAHGKWNSLSYNKSLQKSMYVYFYDRKIHNEYLDRSLVSESLVPYFKKGD